MVRRLEVESIGHNLTSVMMNPRDASMSDLDVRTHTHILSVM